LHSRLPENLKGEILAISALDHYLQVLTEKGSATVHGRFADAVSEMPVGSGWQVHRSHWVHRSAIRRLLVEQQRYSIERVDGTVVPVSSRYVEVLKMAGFKPHTAAVRKS
jgi:DNA-binding LytR/AlgR family response regulator